MAAKKQYTKPEPVVRRPFSPSYPPSEEQERIFEAKKEGGNIGIDAGPGSGKSTTLKWSMTVEPKKDKDAVMLALMKSIVLDIEPECAPHVQVGTCHSFGYKALAKRFGRLFVQNNKIQSIFKELFPALNPDDLEDEERGTAYAFMFDFLKLVDMVRVNLVDEKDSSAVRYICNKYGIDECLIEFDKTMDCLQKVIKKSCESGNMIDFVDMMWLPIRLGLDVPSFSTVYVDERQDLNPLMIEYVSRMCKERIIHVGDEKQSIMGFAGADTNSTKKLVEKFGGQQLPLKVCYRCGTDIVAFAQQVYPDILPFSKNPTGTVESREELDWDMPDGGMILSRRNSSLIAPCFAFLRRGRKAIIKGKDVGATLLKLVKAMKAKNTFELIDKIQIHRDSRIEKLLKQKGVSPAMIEKIQDECACIIEIAMGCRSVIEVENRIESLFDESTKGVLLSSIHKSKGLEADQVSIVDFKRIRMSNDKMSEDDHIQEKNLDFVARTRAKKILHLVDKP